MSEENLPATPPTPHKRRPRYRGKNPRRFEEKYKEHGSDTATIAKVVAAGKTPAGTHRPIMVAEILAVLAPKPGEIAVDGTLGYGGHAQEILAKILPGGKLLGLDHDPIELPKTEARLRALGFDETVFTAHRSNFAGLPQILALQEIAGADLILADLGVSSMQIDDPARGFSVKFSGPLDMRMDATRGQTAADLANMLSEDALSDILRLYGEEKRAKSLARAIIAARPIARTRELAEIAERVLGRGAQKIHPATRMFQALRIAVNDELGELERGLEAAERVLQANGRLAVVSFHSLEDRIVKQFLVERMGRIGHGSRHAPTQAPAHAPSFRPVGKNPLQPGAEEVRKNPRARSAKLRAAERTAAPAWNPTPAPTGESS